LNQLLKEAFEKAAQLPEDEQEKFARFLLAELESEWKWDELFAHPDSDDLLTRLADEALADHRAGKTTALDLQDL
jgi:macrodomain Ter protein organizer (MatP/YcbG family)